MQTPITLEEAGAHLKTALKLNDEEGIKKWDSVIRSINDYRVKSKQRERRFVDLCNQASLRRSYKRTS